MWGSETGQNEIKRGHGTDRSGPLLSSCNGYCDKDCHNLLFRTWVITDIELYSAETITLKEKAALSLWSLCSCRRCRPQTRDVLVTDKSALENACLQFAVVAFSPSAAFLLSINDLQKRTLRTREEAEHGTQYFAVVYDSTESCTWKTWTHSSMRGRYLQLYPNVCRNRWRTLLQENLNLNFHMTKHRNLRRQKIYNSADL